MARTKQTAWARMRGGKPATFPWSRAPVPAGGRPAPLPGGQGGQGGQGGKAPQGRAPTRRKVGWHAGKIPLALCIAHKMLHVE